MQVLVHSGAIKIPAGLVKKRWTTSAREGVDCIIPGYKDAVARGDDASSMHGLLHACAMELVGLGTTSRQAFEVAVDYVSQAKAAITSMTVDDPGRRAFHAKSVMEDSASELVFDASCAAPPRVRSRGRPKELRFKSPIESPGARKKPSSATTNAAAVDEERPRRSTRFLKTGVYIVEHCGACGSTQHITSGCPANIVEAVGTATQRRCKSCGEAGHNRSTCGRKSTYVAK
jgi:hypothetical protein